MTNDSLLALIPTGSNNAVHANVIAKSAGMTTRELRKNLEYLRRSGAVILSSVNGYYLPADPMEVTAYLKKEERRAKSIFRSLRSARQLQKQLSEKV